MSKQFNVVEALANPEYEAFFRGFTRRKIEARKVVCGPATTENIVFIVLSGQLRVYLSCEGREFTVFTLEPGAVFASHARLTVATKKPSEILVTDLKHFEEGLTTMPGLAVSVIAGIGRGLANTIGIIEGLIFHDVKQRLVRFLLDQAQDHGISTPTGIQVEIDHKTEEIALLIGSTRQSTSLMMNELIKDGLLRRLNRKQIVIPDMTTLKGAA